MREIWLQSNRRALWMGMIAPALLAVVGFALILAAPGLVSHVIGWIAIAVSGCLIGFLGRQLRQPRLAYEPGYMLVYLRLGPPIRVPIDVVECFFLGSGPLKLSDQVSAPYRTVGLIVRLAEKAADWADRPVKPALGRWAEGYILVHGAWCEPLSLEVVSRLNVRLHQIQHPSADECQRTSPTGSQSAGCAAGGEPFRSEQEKTQ